AKQDEEFGISPVCADAWGDWYCYIAQGKVVSQGVDLSLNGALTPNWNIGLGYTYVKSKYAEGEEKGDPYNTVVPKHMFRAFTTYHIPGTGWTVGGNVRAQSNSYSTDNVYYIKQSSYALVGLMAKYQLNSQAEISATVDNLFDKKYWYPNNDLVNHYGEPRRFVVNLKYRF
ncbi:MAG: TonB-dependent receptor, partial [Zoogloeaceae bacterium]|nr:TonB-dependent receptor [Zoogloeaceae bacterium]